MGLRELFPLAFFGLLGGFWAAPVALTSFVLCGRGGPFGAEGAIPFGLFRLARRLLGYGGNPQFVRATRAATRADLFPAGRFGYLPAGRRAKRAVTG